MKTRHAEETTLEGAQMRTTRVGTVAFIRETRFRTFITLTMKGARRAGTRTLITLEVTGATTGIVPMVGLAEAIETTLL